MRTELKPKGDSPQAIEKIASQVRTYSQLRRKVEQAFRKGRERSERLVEKEKVRTAWEVGRYLDAHILYHKERALYGEKVIARLAPDVNQNKRFLYYALEFARAYPIVLPVAQSGRRVQIQAHNKGIACSD